MADDAPPSARERDTTAIVDAAIELFADRGPSGVSLREVAARAGVNYGLIHQYIGNKDDLLRLVMRRVSEATAAQFATAASPGDALAQTIAAGTSATPYLRMLARTLLDGHDPAELLGRSPALSELIRQLVAQAPDDVGAGEVGARDPDDAAVRGAAVTSGLI